MSTVPRHSLHTVRASARLHLGFVDLHGGLGRRFGSIGLAIDGLDAVAVAAQADAIDVAGPHSERIATLVTTLCQRQSVATGAQIRILAMPPAHAGLGSGTVLALAAGTACASALGMPLGTREIAQLAQRGERSGIGIGVFEQGGFLLDGGRGPKSSSPPLLSRLPFPAGWRCVLLLDERHVGLSGVAERTAFGSLAAMTETTAGELARRVLVGLLPAIAEADFTAFSEHLGRIQAIVGDYFAPAQGGRFTSSEVGRLLEQLAVDFHLPGIGQSSWGPTGFVFTPDAATAAAVEEACRPRLAEGLRCLTVRASNQGARLEVAG